MRVAAFVTLVFAVIFAASSNVAGQGTPGDEGQEAFDRGDYAEAARVYEALLEESADDPRVHFNLGTARYKQGEWEDALRGFEQSVIAEDAPVRAAAYYNLGNALFRLGRPEESLRSYKLGMELDQEDEDAKFNYEYVKQMLAQALKQQPDDSEEEPRKEPQENRPEEEESGQENRQDQQEQSPMQRESERADEGDRPGVESSAQDLSREEAEQILDALRWNDSEMMKERLRLRTRGRKLEKDW